MFLSIGMLKQKYFLTDIFILSAEKQPIKLSWRKIEWLHKKKVCQNAHLLFFYAQSPDFHKLGLCYYLKILYL